MMGALTFEPTTLKDVYLVTPFLAEDERGYFSKGFEQKSFHAQGISFDVAEQCQSWSKRGVLRGLHFQGGRAQGKLVHAPEGRIFDVAVDLRPGSETFGRWEGFILGGGDLRALLVPEGFAHGFLVLSDHARVSYLCSNPYLPEHDTGLRWDDPDLAVAWPLEQDVPLIVSARDQALPSFADYRATLSDKER